MRRKDLNNEWAWTQIEAIADDALHGASRVRMEETLRRDSKLRAAVARAESVRRALQRSPQPAVRVGLLATLLRIPAGRAAGHRFLTPARTAAAAAAIAAAAVMTALLVPKPMEPAESEQRMAAIREFELAMQYMQKGALITRDEVGAAVSDGLREALIASRNSVREHESERRRETGG